MTNLDTMTQTAWSEKIRNISYRHAVIIGLVGSIVVALCSYAVGATRERGGIMQLLGLSSLTFGHMQGMLTVVLWIGIGLLLISWILVGGHMIRGGARLTRTAVAAWTVPFAFSAPMMSRDIYSYLMQGTLARDGMDPYTQGAAANPGPLLFEVSADWRNTTTPYGPLHLWLGDMITSVTGDHIAAGEIVYRILSLLSVAIIAWALATLAPRFGAQPHIAVWLGVLNPLCLIHLIGGMHNENIMMALVMVGYVAAIRMRPLPGTILAAILIGAAAAIKVTAIIALPFLVWIIVARTAGSIPREKTWRSLLLSETPRRFGALLVYGLTAAVTTVVTMVILTALSGQTWGWVTQVTGNTKVINPLALPSFIASTLQLVLSPFETGLTFNTMVETFRPISTLLMIIGLVITWWLYRHDEQAAIKGATVAYLVTCVLNTVTLPWYYAAPLAFIGLWVHHTRGIYIVSVFIMWLSMMFDGGGNNRLYSLWWVLAMAAIMIWLASTALKFEPFRPLVRRVQAKNAVRDEKVKIL